MVLINKKIRYQVEDVLSGKNVWGKYVFLKESETWDKSRIEEYQLTKLRQLLEHCYNNVPAYRGFMKQSGLNPDNITSLETLKQFPIIDKQYILNHYNDFIPTNISKIKGVKSSKTSGSTGLILKYFNDSNCRSVVWGSFLRFQDWMGRDFNNRYIVFRGRNFINESIFSKLKNGFVDYLEHSKTLDSYNLQDKDIEVLVNLLKKNPKAILRGYVLNIVDIASILKNKGLSYSIQAVSTTAEPLLDFHRKIIQDTFNCGVFDQYGCGEIEGVAYECNQHKGLHVTEEHVILETDNNDELILTDLDNFSFPFIRYKNGDKVLLSKNKCTCGRDSKLIDKIIGRSSDNVIGLNGNPVHWGYFHHLLIYTNIATNRNLQKFQIIQKSLSEIVVNIQSDPLSENDKNILIDEIKAKLGEIHVVVNNVENIPHSETGKFKAIISYVTNPQ
ncbi:MAG: hypothetical protein A2041_09575 [Bacteroidetes bacterium GWA2_31_9b]|nr:MAG: hypothetical protein A2041_09575 [Bacteroidetes bacterium GWA2_31_9b]